MAAHGPTRRRYRLGIMSRIYARTCLSNGTETGRPSERLRHNSRTRLIPPPVLGGQPPLKTNHAMLKRRSHISETVDPPSFARQQTRYSGRTLLDCLSCASRLRSAFWTRYTWRTTGSAPCGHSSRSYSTPMPMPLSIGTQKNPVKAPGRASCVAGIWESSQAGLPQALSFVPISLQARLPRSKT